MTSPLLPRLLVFTILVLGGSLVGCQRGSSNGGPYDVAAHYDKHEYQIPMRDGVQLYTVVYVPKDRSETYPFLVKRSPYSSGPYGKGNFRDNLGPVGSSRFAEEGYIFVYQDVRGRFMSEGQFLHVTPHHVNKQGPQDVDESTDMYDTVEWLLENVEGHNGRVGLWGISYPGFYAAASVIDTHPAIKASSPQAPVGDWFIGDDFHHNGAFYLQDAFNFFSFFESPGPNPTAEWGPRFDYPTNNAYQFFLDMGPLPNGNTKHFKGRIAFWDSLMQNGTYNDFWQRRNIIPHLSNINTNVMTVAGYFDAEDPYGPIQIYKSIEAKNPGINNTLVLGPWFHGGWVRSDGDRLGNVSFEHKTSTFYQENVDLPFFNYYLKDKGTLDLPEVLAYATGSNAWHRLEQWPPAAAEPLSLYLHAGNQLAMEAPTDQSSGNYDAYVSDPANPVPYTQEIRIDRTREYMVEDQRFVQDREDVLVYQSDVLTEDVTVVGPLDVNLFVSTTGTDADFIVKLIDVYPDDFPDVAADDTYLDVPMGGYQMMVRGEVFRAKFRNSFEDPEPLTPGAVTEVSFAAPDIFYTFKAGHRIMVQVQSTWFPLVDRNPQTFTDIYSATEDAFQAATHRVYRSAQYPSNLTIGRLE